MSDKKRVMIVDQLNMFFRAYIVDPSLSSNGQPIGGIKGCLKILQKLCRDVKPDKVIVCWDGAGGSAKRKLMNKGYKDGRRPLRLNRDIRTLSAEEERENKVWQQMRVIEYFNQLPLIQFMYSGVEADDVISYVKSSKEFEGWQKVIVSSDKDFFQLTDNETIILRPTQKEVVSHISLQEKFGISAENFALARAIVGDSSDNLSGVKGAGLKTVAKRYPFLSEQKSYTLDDIMQYSAEQAEETNIKLYENVVSAEDLITRNYKMMQLYAPMLDISSKKDIDDTLSNADLGFNKTEFKTMMISDGFGEYNWNELYSTSKRLSLY